LHFFTGLYIISLLKNKEKQREKQKKSCNEKSKRKAIKNAFCKMIEAPPLWEQCVAALVKRFLAMATYDNLHTNHLFIFIIFLSFALQPLAYGGASREEAAGEAPHHRRRRAALAVSAEVAAVGDRVAQAMLRAELVDDYTLPLFAALPGVTRLPLQYVLFATHTHDTHATYNTHARTHDTPRTTRTTRMACTPPDGMNVVVIRKLPFLSRGALTGAAALCGSLRSLNATATRYTTH
jgi:hypothetical protein